MHQKKKGFTLVELVVVVLIIALLAAIAAPRFLGMTAKANDSGAKHTLAILRDAIELYVAEKNSFPATPATDLLPYLRDSSFPECKVGGFSLPGSAQVETVAAGATATLAATASATKGWKYNSDNGDIIINSADTAKIEAVQYDSW